MIDTAVSPGAWLAAGVPATYLLAAVLAVGPARARRAAWSTTLALAGFVLLVVVAAGAYYGLASPANVLIGRLPVNAVLGLAPSVRLDPLTLAMLALIGFIGLVILNYSRRYLAGDPGSTDVGQQRYRRWFCATLACISSMVIANQLLVLGVALAAASLCLHQLLTYYSQRPQALLAAHKKFLISRMADVFILTGSTLIGLHYGSFQMDAVFASVDGAAFTPTLTVATTLIACAAILKCAQLPFHGWLIQVMEAPTPVSALLHAGIVNMGGFLIIRFAPLMAPAGLAQALLVIAGTTTAVLAALIMTTRVSIKVMLAWSTCAQMGFMLIECGLGLYNLALLHLLAHSFYKAHSFLSAGEMVSVSIQRARTPAATGMPAAGWLAVGGAGALVILGLFVAGVGHPGVFAVIVLAVASLLGDAAGSGRALLGRAAAAAVAVVCLYLAWASLSMLWVPAAGSRASTAGQVAITLAFAALFVLRAMLASAAGARRLRRLHPHVYGGFYLDQMFTRLTLLIWPPRLPARPRVASAAPVIHEKASA
ncbi:NADH-quinone oxidoreductase subunit L [Salinisphaera sp.]|uniref:NADH-quinone oxidoreductase subunit L n=1 Tax=Salinisphaera sp. TaxID=1914330 RepID=UPI002D788B7F|nr:NADH-quinone oxidoreductase subunit L [Salinisphaera sp.]HET7313070.1 NADH-quinone oxidoreductase subunit L [Salinisphaera sp.]